LEIIIAWKKQPGLNMMSLPLAADDVSPLRFDMMLRHFVPQ
jgi:hypothetical protein